VAPESLRQSPVPAFYYSSLPGYCFYFAEKKSGNKAAKGKIEILTQHLYIAENKKADVFKALKNKKIYDIEERLEYYAAHKSDCTCIITEDVHDFYFSEIEVLKPKDFLLMHGV
jgi:hypothetical protein